ncbi:MAG: class I SAM-dependent methyltransferase, partial [Candidatus Zixiibacteriota bacterium]
MKEDESKDIESVKKEWDEHAERYDEYYQDFNGAVEHYVDWELLKGHLPENKDAKILDAAGGTGRITLPLVRMGYPVTLCDISPAMLNVARQKLKKEGFLDKVEILECDVRKLSFLDESFDLVICWDGTMEAAGELIRVTKKGGKISIFLVNKCGSAISKFSEDPGSALSLLRSKSSVIQDEKEKHLCISPEEAEEYFKKLGIKVIGIYAVCGMQEFLSIPDEILKSKTWDDKYFKQTTEMLLRLSKEPSVKGITRHLVLYGEKI